jgi:hypothetical protein
MTMGPWGINLDRTITWWDQGQAWMKYITRCQYLLQSGRFVADIVTFTGEEGPNDLPLMRGKEIPYGYDYDGCDATVLNQMRVENGQILLPTGMRYRVLVLPKSMWMTTKTIKKVAQLVKDGATVVGVSPQKSPSLTDYPEGDKLVQDTAKDVWNTNATNHAYSGALEDVLASKKITPDVTANKPLNWIHRVADGADIYFVANPAYKPVDMDLSFRIGDRQPELFNPETGTVEDAPIWQSREGRTKVSLRFESAGSTFVVFRKAPSKRHLTSLVWLGESDKEPKPPVIEIISARYEAVDGTGGIDVTDKTKSMVAHGETTIESNNANFGDPFYNHVKQLHLVYTIDGKRMERNIEENGSLEFANPSRDDVLPKYTVTDGKIQQWAVGNLKFTTSDGTTGIVGGKSTNLWANVPWVVKFATKKQPSPSLVMTKLSSWTESTEESVKYFSGTATYETNLRVEKSATTGVVWLDLGRVKNFADVELNGHKFETLWKAPFRLDVTKFLKAGDNKLEVKVTNLWPNRLIGDDQYAAEAKYNNGPIAEWPKWILDGTPRPPTKRTTFTTWKFFNHDSQLLESGLLGPVRLVTVHPIDPSKLKAKR